MPVLERLQAVDQGADVPTFGSYIGGALTSVSDDATSIRVEDPATGREIARIADAAKDGVEAAVAAGQAAFDGWRRTPVRERGAILSEYAKRIAAHADDLAWLDALDTGNPLTAMRADVTKGIRALEEAAHLGLQITGQTYPLPGLHYTQREPWGVVGRIITFNHPSLFMGARLGPALIAGNCVVVKASELAPLTALAMAELADGVLPPGVLNVVSGGPATGDALIRHPAVRRLSFTGSTPTALKLQAAAAASGHLKDFTFELGGKNPIVVFPDVDVDEVATEIVRGMNYTRVQGQSCGSTSRLVIHESIAEPVLERVVRLAEAITIGRPTDPATEMGAMISRQARDRCVTLTDEASRGGARVLTGGTVPTGEDLAGGHYMTPTVVDRVDPDSALARQEVFGPVLAAMTFAEEADAIELANEGPFGLSAAIWTNDIDRALRLADAIEAGYLWINDVETRFPTIPFGGWGDSGVGVENGIAEILSFTRLKAVNVRVRR